MSKKADTKLENENKNENENHHIDSAKIEKEEMKAQRAAAKAKKRAERAKVRKWEKEERQKKKDMDIRWDRLDNTAHIFPVIAGEALSNVYRISVELNEEIQCEPLQEALGIVLPKFDGFNLRLRQGIFWYYFEENGKPAPKVVEESNYPCQFIVQNRNRSYMFRVSYYGYRINLEVFHVLTDGMGGTNFLKELTYQYLRLVHPELREKYGDKLMSDTSLNREDSFLKNYKKGHANAYKKEKAYILKGERFRKGEFAVIHCFVKIPQLKEVCHAYGVSINEYLVASYTWSVYTECMHGAPNRKPIRVAVPVNLRPYFNSITTKNFFTVISAEFKAENEEYSFEEVLSIVKESLRSQLNKQHLEELFSYNVSNEKILIARAVPLAIKRLAIIFVYTNAALANTATVTNIGTVKVAEEYREYFKMFYAFLAMSKGQYLKGTICSFDDTLCFSFSSILKDPSVQRGFFRRLSEDGLEVELASNGVYYE